MRRGRPHPRLAIFVLAAISVAAATAEPIEVFIAKPSPLDPSFGPVEVEADVHSEGTILGAELWVDGRRIAMLTNPPFRWRVDVGYENRSHTYEVIARGEHGTSGSSKITTPPIHVDDELDLDLQQFFVTVTRDGRRVLGLEESRFELIDDGVKQKMVTFSGGDLPLTAVLLLDSSQSMRGERMQAALRGAQAFVEGMQSLDEAMLMLFSDQLLFSTPFSSEPAALLAALEDVEASGNTAVNDHLYLSLKLLEARQGRRVVVLFSDGADLHSVLAMEDVLWKARRSQALIYWIRLEIGNELDFATAWRDAEANRREQEILERVVEASGGRIASLSSTAEIEPAFREILRELREQYVLGYYPDAVRNDGAWHEVEVRVRGSGLRVRTRGGYVDF